MPIDIRFRLEEKQFDIDGVQNIRYAVMKKRVDKATIKGRGERITRPGHIAIICGADREYEAYARYIQFLQRKAYITAEPEHFDLEDMQGVHGLKAFRLKVNLDQKLHAAMDPQEMLKEALSPEPEDRTF